ncbi:MAG TPA: hypothetical protein EYG76_01220 [Methanothermococcus okinawensis]|uniref:4-vinyl reductase 4VR n=1 Tax=Methanothermococcus okinawensis TaxID=155863 RepID=A0A832YSU5_9EURY|nr:hypothetical protein [Methanothermococcus okinawensis]
MEPISDNKLKYILDNDISIQQYFCILLLSVLAELIDDPQLFIDSIMKTIGPNMYVILKAKGLIKDNYSNFGDLIRDINKAMDISDNIDVIYGEDGSLIAFVHLKDNNCKYCPKGIGGADLGSTCCPFIILFEAIGEEVGLRYRASEFKKENNVCKIVYKIVKEKNNTKFRKLFA